MPWRVRKLYAPGWSKEMDEILNKALDEGWEPFAVISHTDSTPDKLYLRKEAQQNSQEFTESGVLTAGKLNG